MMSFKIKTLLVALLGWSGMMLQAKEPPSQQGFMKVPGGDFIIKAPLDEKDIFEHI